MDDSVSDPGHLLDQFHHPTGGPQTSRVSQGFGSALESRLDLVQVGGFQLGLSPRPPGSPQRRRAQFGQLPLPAIHRLPMDPDPASYFRLGQPLGQ